MDHILLSSVDLWNTTMMVLTSTQHSESMDADSNGQFVWLFLQTVCSLHQLVSKSNGLSTTKRKIQYLEIHEKGKRADALAAMNVVEVGREEAIPWIHRGQPFGAEDEKGISVSRDGNVDSSGTHEGILLLLRSRYCQEDHDVRLPTLNLHDWAIPKFLHGRSSSDEVEERSKQLQK
ncbi:hypothetical protein PMAYCL1PPCAC_30790, partial [Pristionchus mayeri]